MAENMNILVRFVCFLAKGPLSCRRGEKEEVVLVGAYLLLGGRRKAGSGGTPQRGRGDAKGPGVLDQLGSRGTRTRAERCAPPAHSTDRFHSPIGPLCVYSLRGRDKNLTSIERGFASFSSVAAPPPGR